MNESPRCGALSFLVVFDILFLPVREKRSRKTYRFLLVSDGLDRSFENYLFRCSSTVEQLPVKELVVGSSPTTGAKLEDTSSPPRGGVYPAPSLLWCGAPQRVNWLHMQFFMAKKELAGGVVHKMPADLRKAIISAPPARSIWDDITPLARNEWICWVISGKKAETRIIRIEKALSKLKGGMRRPCCWAGCPHR